jgi:chitinase
VKRLFATLCALAVLGGASTVFSGANFAIQTSNPQTATASTDFVAPTVTSSVIATTASGNPFDGSGFVTQGGTYRIYANVTDAGNPASGVATVTADVTSVSDGGHSAVALAAGSYTVGGVTYNYASAEQTVSNPLTEGSKSYTVTATDNASNTSSPASFSVTVDDTAPSVSGSTIARTDGAAPGFIKQGDSYFVYANASDSSSGLHAVTANVAVASNVITTAQSAASLSTTGGPWTVNGVTYGYRSAQLTADSSLSEGAKAYTITATDNASNSFTSPTSGADSFSVTVDNTAPPIAGSVIATTSGGSPIDGPGAVRAGGTYKVYADVSDARSGIQSVTANVAVASNVINTGQTSVPLTFDSTGVTFGGTTYHWISAQLTADAGLTQGSKSYTVTALDNVSNSTGPQTFSVFADTTSPTVSLTSPTGTSNVRDGITPAATATDNNGVAFVKIQRSPAGANTWTDVCTITGAGPTFSCSFATTSVTDGLYDFRAVATDKGGNTTNSALATNVRVDNTPPAVTMADPGSPLSGTVPLSSSSATDTGGSGVASVKYQLAPTGTTTWSDACTGTTGPSFSCNFDTSTAAAGFYDFRAIATDNAGNAATSATIGNRQITQQPPVGVKFDTTNCTGAGCAAGRADQGDTISFTYSRAMDPASIVPATTNPVQAAWDGTSPRNVKVTLTQGGANDTLTEVELDTGNTVVSLGSVALGANYLTGTTSSFSPSAIAMSSDGKTFTITLGPFSGTLSQLQTITSAGSVIWTPNAAAKDLGGIGVNTTPVTRSFIAF